MLEFDKNEFVICIDVVVVADVDVSIVPHTYCPFVSYLIIKDSRCITGLGGGVDGSVIPEYTAAAKTVGPAL
jgi:hypothetical protein